MTRIFRGKGLAIFIGVIIIVFIGLYAINSLEIWSYDRSLTKYDIEAIFYPNDKKVEAKLKVEYKNNEDIGFKSLYFHLYPNAFKDKDKAPFPPEEMERAYPKGFTPGYIELESLHIEGEPALFNIIGYSHDKLEISLEEELKPGDRIDLEMDFTIKLPNSPGRFGYGENTYNFGNWYPILCVYDHRGWNLEPYYPLGDPFYSDVSNYRVSIEVPESYEVAATGERVKVQQREGGKTIEFKAREVRDFAWVASQNFKVLEKRVGHTRVFSYYYTEEGGKKALDYGVSALGIFNEIFGRYPYKNLSIVQSDFFIGGMEYPRLVMIGEDLYNEDKDDWLEIVTVHEVAHQWWYGLVGNDQIHAPWLDEGLTEYSTILYYYNRFGQDMGEKKYKELIAKGKYGIYKALKDEESTDETIDRPLYEFRNWLEYDALVYGKGAMMFHHMRESMGDETFFKMLNGYLKDNWLENAQPKDLQRKCEEATGESWGNFFKNWLSDGATP